MSSTLYVDSLIEKTSGNGVHIPGHVIQIQSYTLQGSVTFTNQTSTVNSGLEVSITPKFSNSKIYVTMNLGSFCSLTTGTWCAGRLYRNAAPIPGALATTNTNTNYGNLDGYSFVHASIPGIYKPTESSGGVQQVNHSVKPASFNYLDSPNSTNTQTYALYVYVRKNVTTTGALNRTPDNAITSDHAIQALSTITVQEIAQ